MTTPWVGLMRDYAWVRTKGPKDCDFVEVELYGDDGNDQVATSRNLESPMRTAKHLDQDPTAWKPSLRTPLRAVAGGLPNCAGGSGRWKSNVCNKEEKLAKNAQVCEDVIVISDDEHGAASPGAASASVAPSRTPETPSVTMNDAAIQTNETDDVSNALDDQATSLVKLCTDEFARSNHVDEAKGLKWSKRQLEKKGLTTIQLLADAPDDMWPLGLPSTLRQNIRELARAAFPSNVTITNNGRDVCASRVRTWLESDGCPNGIRDPGGEENENANRGAADAKSPSTDTAPQRYEAPASCVHGSEESTSTETVATAICEESMTTAMTCTLPNRCSGSDMELDQSAGSELSEAEQVDDMLHDEACRVYGRFFLLQVKLALVQDAAEVTRGIPITVTQRSETIVHRLLDAVSLVKLVEVAGGTAKIGNIATAAKALGLGGLNEEHAQFCQRILSTVKSRSDLFSPILEVYPPIGKLKVALNKIPSCDSGRRSKEG